MKKNTRHNPRHKPGNSRMVFQVPAAVFTDHYFILYTGRPPVLDPLAVKKKLVTSNQLITKRIISMLEEFNITGQNLP
jgi:hypothetical protein